MKTRSLLQLYSGPSGTAGEHGFRLTGHAKEGDGLCRVQLRYMEPWHRYPSPRLRSTTWDLRVYTRTDAAFVLETEIGPDDLDQLGEIYTFPDGADALAKLSTNGDVVHDRVLAWARKVTGSAALDAPKEINPVHLKVRYQQSDAARLEIPRIPRGRPLPPGQSPLILNAKDKPLKGSGLQTTPPRVGASANDRGAAATPSAPSAPKASIPPPKAAPSSAGPTKPAPPKSGGASALTERLQAIRDQAEKNKAPSGDNEA